ncbi:bacteriophage minor capsid protein [Enterococcus malodoratus]|uniref:minor capsid protein n=1 Tax=Enterococcus malodoratus TaxID=71451 RepID=UPI0008B614DB|nr:minor capsid protein [Enterococcus malodoratus]SET33237.1 bacteriophage minor capsid protein [Enterococcus malodoratus]
MDFIDRIKESINSIEGLPIKIRKGYLSADESLVIYPLPGGQVITEFYDGIKDQQLNYEIAMKSKDGDKIEKVLWLISDYLEQLEELKSQNETFEFNGLTITSKPFINDADEQGWFVFLLDFQAKLTTFKGEK